jgi:SSS family solute:Na+ symporter
VVIVAVIYIPTKLGGWGDIFAAANEKFDATPPPPDGPSDGLTLAPAAQLGYSTLALGSAMALFLYPHSLTSVLAARSRDTIKRNMAALPAYSFVLGLLALLGYMAIAAGVEPTTNPLSGKPDNNTVVPLLFDQMFPDWFAGVAFAAIAIGALVPAAIMSIAAANLFTRNVFKEYIKKDASPALEAKVSKIASLVVKFGALLVIIAIDPQFSIDLQLIGGVVILQTLPALVLGLYTRWFHRWALLAGWAVGLVLGLSMLYRIANPLVGKEHFAGSQWALSRWGFDTDVTVYVGLIAVAANLLVAAVGTYVLRAMKAPAGEDVTQETDYHVEAGDPAVDEMPADTGAVAR